MSALTNFAQIGQDDIQVLALWQLMTTSFVGVGYFCRYCLGLEFGVIVK